MTSQLTAALAVFEELGWPGAGIDDVMSLPLGSADQRRIARTGLASGEWDMDHGQDRDLLCLFAIRVGVPAGRAAQLIETHPRADPATVMRVLIDRGERFAAGFVREATRPRRSRGVSRYAIGVRSHFRLPVPDDAVYLREWSWVTYGLLHPTTSAATTATAPTAGMAPLIGLDDLERDFAQHVRIAATSSGQFGGFGDLMVLGVQRDWLDRSEALDLAFVALDSAQRPGDRKEWLAALTAGLGVTESEVLGRSDSVLTILSVSDPGTVEAFAPILIASSDDDIGGQALVFGLAASTKKARRAVLRAAKERSTPPDEGTVAGVQALTHDRDPAMAKAAQQVLDAWGVADPQDQEPGARALDGDAADDPPVLGLWQPTPPVWAMPPFDVGPVSEESLTQAAAELSQRTAVVVDVAVERFLALANALAYTDPPAARRALAGLRETWSPGLSAVAAWVNGQDPTADRHGSYSAPLLPAREGNAAARLGLVPELLSTPSWQDLSIEPAALVQRLSRYREDRVSATEADLFLALTRLRVDSADAGTIKKLQALRVPVLRSDGTLMAGTAGSLAAQYCRDPLRPPALTLSDNRRWIAGGVRFARSVEQFPDRIITAWERNIDQAAFPTWGDVTGPVAGWGTDAEMGLVLRQQARSAEPLPGGLAVNMLAVQRSPHPAAATDAALAVTEAWERGLLVPGIADVTYFGWDATPAGLAGFATAAQELAHEGLLSVLWPVLDDLVVASTRAPRLLPGTAEIVALMTTLLPEVQAALRHQSAPAGALDLPGVRALAARSGSSLALTAARDLLSRLPEPANNAGAVDPEPIVDLEQVWLPGAGGQPVIDDGATVSLSARDSEHKNLYVDLELPAAPGRLYRVRNPIHPWLRQGMLATVDLGALPPTQDPYRATESVTLAWEQRAGALVPRPMPQFGQPWQPRTGPITSSMVAVWLVGLAQATPGTLALSEVSEQVGAPAVGVAMSQLLGHEDFSPTGIMKLIETRQDLLAVLWPVLTESMAYAASVPAVPTWLNRVLDAALHVAPTLAAAGGSGRIPDPAASWHGASEVAQRGGSSAVVRKAGELWAALGLDATNVSDAQAGEGNEPPPPQNAKSWFKRALGRFRG